MPRDAIFFDRDNTLIIEDGYLGDATRVRLMPGAASAVARARSLGYAVVVISNQSGVARGMFTEDAVRAVDARLAQLLKSENPNALLDAQEFCPFHPSAILPQYRLDSPLRKPKPGMILKARSNLGLSDMGWMIGDAPRDIAAGAAAGLRTILFKPHGEKSKVSSENPGDARPDFEANTLEEAMNIIESQTRSDSTLSVPATMAPPTPSSATVAAPGKVEALLEQLLTETRRRNEHRPADFSIAKLLAGILQVLTLALLFLAYIRQDGTQTMLLLVIFMQLLVTTLLLMSRA